MKPKQPRQRSVVDRAIRAVRQRPVPDGPPAEVLSTILDAETGSEDQAHPIRLTKRRVTMKRLATTAAAAAIIAGLLLGFSYLLKDDNGNIAFADVLERMQKIKTVTWTTTEKHSVSKKYNPKWAGHFQESDRTDRVSYKAPGHVRIETSDKITYEGKTTILNYVRIMDVTTGKYLYLDRDKKTAELKTEEPAGKPHGFINYLTRLKKKIVPEAESLGKRVIGGHDTIGFRVRKGGNTTDLWVDAKTKNLVLVVITNVVVSDRVIWKWVKTLRDFEFDGKLDDSRFSLEVPKGYKKQPPREILSDVLAGGDVPPPATEKDLIDGLLLWAVGYDGSFPAESTFKIDDAEQIKGDKDPKIVNLSSERHRVVRRFVRLCAGDSWHYAGKGVKLGDKQAAVCWYRPKDSKTYRVIYGDLSVRDVTPDALPKKR
ncbi:MAG: hypothetical protein IID44_13280 [Planctomycetes bacterium]|nr:hypothetical protein [Planctomycetota bacterium]